MANLKEILPMLAAGVAGAASPRGADVFMDMANMMQQRKRQKSQDIAQERRLALAEQAGSRQAEAHELMKEEKKASASLREIQLSEAKSKAEAAQRARESLDAAREFSIQNIDEDDPMAKEQAFAYNSATSYDQLDEMRQRYGRTSLEEEIQRFRDLGVGGSYTRDGATYRIPGQDKDGNVATVGDAIVALQDDKGFRGYISELESLKDEEMSLISETGVVEPGTLTPVEKAKLFEAKRNRIIQQAAKRAALVSNGNETVFASAMEDIYRAAGLPMPKAETGQVAGGGTITEEGMASSHGEGPTGEGLWKELHGDD